MLQEIKRQFLAYRNGIVADTLRAAGLDCYHIIFGLNLPQLTQIAATQTPSLALANALWADRAVRESRLLAPYLFPRDEVTPALALTLLASVQTQEEADILTFRLLRHLPFFSTLTSPNPYAATSLARYRP